MPITYDPDTNTITVVGTKDGNPWTFEDIYQADVNNGWGVFTKLSEGVYKTTAKLQFGDGSTETWFEEKGTVLIIEHVATADLDTVVEFKANCNAKFGEILNVNGDNVYYDGVTFILRDTTYLDAQIAINNGSSVEFYNCKFTTTTDSKRSRIFGYGYKMKGCIVDVLLFSPRYCEIEDTVITGRFGHITSPMSTIMDNITFLTFTTYAIWLSNNDTVISNSDIVARVRLASVSNLQSPNTAKFINCKAHNWIIAWRIPSGATSGEIQRIYAVRFKVTDINGNPLANRVVKVYDKNGNKVAEAVTDSNGLTEEIEIVYAKLTNPYADDTWHTFTESDWEYFNPFTIEVYYGNELEYRGVITDLDVESTFIQITTKPSSYTLDDIANKIEYVRKLLGNRWKIENNELKIYDDDNQTVIRRFKLYDKQGNPSEIEIYDRIPEE